MNKLTAATRPKWYRMSCGHIYSQPEYRTGNYIYCSRHVGPKRRVRVAAVITLCMHCRRGMVLESRSSRAKYCRLCAKEIQRIHCRNRNMKRKERRQLVEKSRKDVRKLNVKGWMRPEDYFAARYDENGFTVPDEIYHKNLERIKYSRLVSRYGETTVDKFYRSLKSAHHEVPGDEQDRGKIRTAPAGDVPGEHDKGLEVPTRKDDFDAEAAKKLYN